MGVHYGRIRCVGANEKKAICNFDHEPSKDLFLDECDEIEMMAPSGEHFPCTAGPTTPQKESSFASIVPTQGQPNLAWLSCNRGCAWDGPTFAAAPRVHFHWGPCRVSVFWSASGPVLTYPGTHGSRKKNGRHEENSTLV